MKVGLISLGCAKNQVDAELMLAKIAAAGFEISDSPVGCDVVIINTCAFIEAAKKEAIENILDMAQVKSDGDLKKIVVTGCLAERYRDEVIAEMPEVDAVVGLGANGDIVDILRAIREEEHYTSFPPKTDMPLCGDRLLTTPPYQAYIRIAEGCSNGCSYCAIPFIRGGYRSRPMEDILSEAEKLADGGVKELTVIAQDTTYYGMDLYGEYKLAELLRGLCRIEKLSWIRVLYCYPERITDELLDVFGSEKKLLKYIDLPLQHADGRILAAMGRRGDRQSLTELIAKIRARIPDVTLRTTCLVGFPGEDDEAFSELYDFIGEVRFDKLGCFTYSAEEGTRAAKFEDQVDPDTAERRNELIMERQFRIQEELARQKIGRDFEAIVEGYDGFSDSYYGRLCTDCPEVDSMTSFTCPWELDDGDIVTVRILGLSEDGYDLIGEVL